MLRYRGTGSGSITLEFTSAPSGSPDDLPSPRMAILPDGRLDVTASLFASGPLDPILKRDHVRVVANVAVVLLPDVDHVSAAIAGKPEIPLAVRAQKEKSSREKPFRSLPLRVERDAGRGREIGAGLDEHLLSLIHI